MAIKRGQSFATRCLILRIKGRCINLKVVDVYDLKVAVQSNIKLERKRIITCITNVVFSVARRSVFQPHTNDTTAAYPDPPTVNLHARNLDIVDKLDQGVAREFVKLVREVLYNIRKQYIVQPIYLDTPFSRRIGYY